MSDAGEWGHPELCTYRLAPCEVPDDSDGSGDTGSSGGGSKSKRKGKKKLSSTGKTQRLVDITVFIDANSGKYTRNGAAKKLDISRSTFNRDVETLEEKGSVKQDEDGKLVSMKGA